VKILMAAALMIQGAFAGQTEMIVSYGFNDTLEPSSSAGYTRADSFARGKGITGSGFSAVRMEGGKSLIFLNNGFNSGDKNSAFDANRYLSFTITVRDGYQINFSELGFSALRLPTDGAGAPDSYGVYTSLNCYARAVGLGTVPVATSDSDKNFSPCKLDLSEVESLQGVKGRVEFRIYFWSEQGIGTPSQRTFRLDNLYLKGAVAAIQDTEAIVVGHFLTP